MTRTIVSENQKKTTKLHCTGDRDEWTTSKRKIAFYENRTHIWGYLQLCWSHNEYETSVLTVKLRGRTLIGWALPKLQNLYPPDKFSAIDRFSPHRSILPFLCLRKSAILILIVKYFSSYRNDTCMYPFSSWMAGRKSIVPLCVCTWQADPKATTDKTAHSTHALIKDKINREYYFWARR